MDLMLVLLAVTAFPVACLGFVLWMGTIEDSIPAGVRRAAREPDPAPILAVPVRRTAAAQAPGWWESVVADAPVAEAAAAPAAPDAPAALVALVAEAVVADTDPARDGAEAHTRPGGPPHSAGESPALDGIPEQRTPAAAPVLPEPLAGT